MPQSGCKTFSFIFKYKKSGARDANAFSIMFRWYVCIFLVEGGQLIDAHAHAARGGASDREVGRMAETVSGWDAGAIFIACHDLL